MIDVPKAKKDDMSDKGPCWELQEYAILGYPRSNQVLLKCPNGHIGVLDHEIAEDGTVTPSVMCDREGCDFHEMIRLLDWGK